MGRLAGRIQVKERTYSNSPRSSARLVRSSIRFGMPSIEARYFAGLDSAEPYFAGQIDLIGQLGSPVRSHLNEAELNSNSAALHSGRKN